MHTPFSQAHIDMLNSTLSPIEATVRAWNDPGKHPDWHYRAKLEVRNAMPALAAALDRLTDCEE